MTMQVTATKSAKPRNYHELPTMYFVATDDWMDKLGEKSFCLYLRLWTMVDRTDEISDNHCIKTRTSKLIKKLDMSKSTYLRLIKPLYEYGLVDLVEFEGSANKGSKPVNIIVHEYPQNKWELSTKELEKCRSWEQRIDENYNFAKQGGRPKKVEELVIELPEAMKEVVAPTKKPVAEIQESVNEVVKTEFDFFKEGMEENGVDLNVVVAWVNKNQNYIAYSKMCFVFKQLATYPSPILKTASFITSTLAKATDVYFPITEVKHHHTATEEVSATTTKVPFYNWLEERE